ncbi:protein ref(2)P-like [Musca autumnalis]|uniref:protein ref(2)P-like n=1 Tax=Musca autumnalis TaxID=221902 RepID=UPI003CEEC9B1
MFSISLPAKHGKETATISVYHPDERINNSLHSMMLMGFNNDDDWLTKLLESVNANIPDAISIISATQRDNR